MVVAFSGGVDSSLLLAATHEVLGSKTVAVTAVSDIHPRRETDKAQAFAREKKIRHLLLPLRETGLPGFAANPADRCYHCKRHLFEALLHVAEQMGISHVVHGANLDDVNDYRPGMRAAQEMNIRSPLIEAKMGKADVRFLARQMGLAFWNQPAMPCLATRIPYGTPITSEKLKMVDRAETFLLNMGIEECRVRHHGTVARLELNTTDMARILNEEVRNLIVAELRDIGFYHVALDLGGYVSGGMNRVLAPEDISRDKGVIVS